MAGQNVKYSIGDEVYHTGYLCSGTIKQTCEATTGEIRYLVDWQESPLKNSTLYLSGEHLASPDFKYQIKKANHKSVTERVKHFRDEVKKDGPQRMSIFSYSGGKIIES